eukprot:702799-Pyramimonas_sp.AAC.1
MSRGACSKLPPRMFLLCAGLALCARPGPVLGGTGRAKKAGQHQFVTVSTCSASPTFPPVIVGKSWRATNKLSGPPNFSTPSRV